MLLEIIISSYMGCPVAAQEAADKGRTGASTQPRAGVVSGDGLAGALLPGDGGPCGWGIV